MALSDPGLNNNKLLRCWFTGVCWLLGLTHILLPRPEENIGQDNGNGEPGRLNRAQVLQVDGPDRAMAALPGADDPDRSLLRAGIVITDEEQSDSEYNFVVRIILLLVFAWVTLLLFNSALIVLSVSLRRALFSAIPITHGIKCNDSVTLRKLLWLNQNQSSEDAGDCEGHADTGL